MKFNIVIDLPLDEQKHIAKIVLEDLLSEIEPKYRSVAVIKSLIKSMDSLVDDLLITTKPVFYERSDEE